MTTEEGADAHRGIPRAGCLWTLVIIATVLVAWGTAVAAAFPHAMDEDCSLGAPPQAVLEACENARHNAATVATLQLWLGVAVMFLAVVAPYVKVVAALVGLAAIIVVGALVVIPSDGALGPATAFVVLLGEAVYLVRRPVALA